VEIVFHVALTESAQFVQVEHAFFALIITPCVNLPATVAALAATWTQEWQPANSVRTQHVVHALLASAAALPALVLTGLEL
jgi:hypothetical protein